MQKNILVLGAVVVLALGAYFLIQNSSSNTASVEKKAEEEKLMQEEKMMLVEKAMIEQKDIENKAMMEKDAMTTDGQTVEKEIMKKDDSAMAKPADTMMQKGSYEAYDQNKLALADKGDVVLFFKASWCPSCKAVDSDIKANRTSIKDGLTILEVDYDNSQALKTKYGVTYQHTFVQVDSKGNQIAKWSGSPTLASLTSNVK
jgi:thiol-disulfide isomerase/thioredoxin